MMQRILDNMATRIFLIVIVGAMVTAIIVALMSHNNRRDNEAEMLNRFTKERVENIIKVLEVTPAEKRVQTLEVWSRMGVNVTLDAEKPDASTPLSPELENLKIYLGETLAQTITPQSNRQCVLPGSVPPHAKKQKSQRNCIAIFTTLQDNTAIQLDIFYSPYHRPAFFNKNTMRNGLILGLIGLVYIAWLISNIATNPLRKLASAASTLATNIEAPAMPENQGSAEVRNAAKAFNNMQQSIRQHIQERTFMLSAIAHDLQTPLTRLRLRLEKVQDIELKNSLIEDLNATQEMLREGLDFARISAENIQKTKVDIDALMKAIVDDARDAGHDVQYANKAKVTMQASPHLLKRCVTNLLDNAIQYGVNPSLAISQQQRMLCIEVSDDGAGVPESELTQMMQPFKRLEDSRSRRTGGTGLGLTIARMIAEKHGGTLTIQNKTAPATGLVATLNIPMT